MNSRVLISDEELTEFGPSENFSQKAEALLNHQKENWNLVKENFDALQSVQTRKYDFGDYYINTQFNPSRIISSSAKVDKESIKNRACFLCEENLPDVQKGIKYKDKYVILCNPYPIFKQHLTIPHHDHIPQSIDSAFSDLMKLSYDLRDNFFVFYNGPKCGASAPDHLHFQAGQKFSTPLEKFYESLIENGHPQIDTNELKMGIVNKDVFNFIYIQSAHPEKLNSLFNKVLGKLKESTSNIDEPLINIISIYENDRWNVLIFPRKVHRPEQFFLENDRKLLISPASVDMMGLLITPRKEDFDKLTSEQIIDIYDQVEYNSSLLNMFDIIG